MRRVIVESPYAAKTEQELERNITYARAALRDCLLRGESPYASHLLYTQAGILDDNEPKEREHGILAGFEWAKVTDYVIIYIDLGITSGMKKGILVHEKANRTIEFRSLKEWKNYLT